MKKTFLKILIGALFLLSFFGGQKVYAADTDGLEKGDAGEAGKIVTLDTPNVIHCAPDEKSGYPLLLWTRSDGTSKYEIERKSDGSWRHLVNVIFDGSEIDYLDRTATEGIQYDYRVRAVATEDGYNDSDWSAVSSSKCVPQKPFDLTITDDANGMPKVSWSTVYRYTGYRVRYAEVGSATWKEIFTTKRTAVISDAVPGKTYNIRVAAAAYETDNAFDSAEVVGKKECPSLPSFTKQPNDATAAKDQLVEFTVFSVGAGITYDWYVFRPGSGIAGYTKEYSCTDGIWAYTPRVEDDGMALYVIATDKFGRSATSNAAVLSLHKTILSAKKKYYSITKTSIQEFEVQTTSDVQYLMLYAEDGNTVKSWPASGNSKLDATGKRNWTLSQPINTVGNRSLVFRGGTTNSTPVTNIEIVSFKVESIGVISVSAKDAVIKKGGEQVFTVKTTSDADYLVEYAEDGKTVVKSWTASSSNSTVNGNVRTWTIKQSINTAGKRNLIFKAGYTRAGAPSILTAPLRTAAFTVEDVWVNSASAKYATIGKNGTQTFTVKTTSNAQNLMLYAEGGNLVKTWAASGNSTVSGDVRTWTVTLAIGTAGNRELTIKAGKTTTPSALGKTVKFAVVEKKLVSASAKYAGITKASMQGFTVTTSADVQYLMLYAEDGKTLVKSWAASGNSTVDANKIRTWYVIQEIATAGNRKLVFKGGTNNTTAVTNALTVSFKVENTGVITASAKNATINKGSTQTFTVTTTADCKYLAEYAENGNLVTSWTANSSNSKVSGNVRTWTVTQTINTAGKRTLTFKAGVSSPTTAERNVSFTVK